MIKKNIKPLIHLFRRSTERYRALPNCIIAGAMRAGTGSLYNYLSEHPDVIRSRERKEVHFFDLHYEYGVNWYRTHFPLAFFAKKSVIMEASPYYMIHPQVPKRIKKLIPNTRIVFLVRNPIDRAYSHYQNNLKKRFEDLTFEEAIQKEVQRIEGEEDTLRNDPFYQSWAFQRFTYLRRGLYIKDILNWNHYFSRTQIEIIQSELLFQKPSEALEKLEDWLCLSHHKYRDLKHHNQSDYSTVLKDSVRNHLAKFFAPYNEKLFKFLGYRLDWRK